jgi:hypothetical protein
MLLCLYLAGCASLRTSDYKLDTTPDHNGEHWIGGE